MQQLLAELDQGNPFVYDELILLAAERLQKLTATMLRNYPRLRRWEQTDDVFQNAVIKLHQSLAEVQPQSVSHFFNLAAIQIRRTLIDLCRHHFGPEGHAAFHHSNQGESDGPVAQTPSRSCRPESLQAWTEFHEQVEKLPSEERDVFQLRWYAGLELSEIANCLGLSLSTVKRRWRAGRLQLRAALQELVEDLQHD